jgi:hypothetical protein
MIALALIWAALAAVYVVWRIFIGCVAIVRTIKKG